MTIGASRPLAPWTVITRTSPPAASASCSRLTSISLPAMSATKRLQVADAAPLGGQRLGQERVQRVLRLARPAGSACARASSGRAPSQPAQHPAVEVERRPRARPRARAQPRSSRAPPPLGPLAGAARSARAQSDARRGLGQVEEARRRRRRRTGCAAAPPGSGRRRGTGRTRASAIRSSKTMCSESASRSAPPTGTPVALQRPDDLLEQRRRAGAPGSARRRRRRAASPPSCDPRRPRRRARPSPGSRGRCAGPASCWRSRGGSASTGASRRRASAVGSVDLQRPEVDAAAGAALAHRLDGMASSRPRRAAGRQRAGSANTASTKASTSGVERQLSSSGTTSNAPPGGLDHAAGSARSPAPTAPASAPWKE